MAVEIEGFTSESKSESSSASGKQSVKKPGSFQSFGLSYAILKGIKDRGYKIPTPIQRKCIPLILSGHDVVAMARTGSGKTACFLLPMFEKLAKPREKANSGARALILSPTRELALQTLKFIKELGKHTTLKAISVLGGESMDYQFGAIHENPDIIVATPGRFLHLCVEMELKLSSVEYVVLDEADRLFELGLGEQIKEILQRLPESRQTVLFSATLPKLMVNFAKAGLSNPVLLRLDVEAKLPKTLQLAFMSVRPEEKIAGLLCILQALPKDKQTVVFTATKHHVDYLHAILDEANITNTFLYSDLAPSARKINVAKFLNGSHSVLVVTDVAARGVDIPQLDYVINYHFPSTPKLFVHRVGRCARAGRSGVAFSLICKSETPYFFDLLTFLGRSLKTSSENSKCSDVGDGIFGKIPKGMLEVEQSRIILWHENNVELESLKKVSENGYKKYLQSNTSASREGLKKVKNMNLVEIGVHPFFGSEEDPKEAMNLINKMKSYKPRSTIFELKASVNQRCFEVMRRTKKAHESHVYKFRQSGKENQDEEEDAEEKDDGSSNRDIASSGKRKNHSWESSASRKRKGIDEEHYVPHFAPDQDTERGLSVNSFVTDANKVAFDIAGDNDEYIKIQKRLKKWDKDKMKYVAAGNREKKRIKTECGTWIDASYKTGKYEKWKERSKVGANDEESESDEETTKNTRQEFPNTHWGRHNRKMAEKLKAKATIKRPEQILKARLELEKKQQKSIPRSKRREFERQKNQRRKNVKRKR